MKTRTKLFILFSLLITIILIYIVVIKVKNETYNEEDAIKIWNNRIDNIKTDTINNEK